MILDPVPRTVPIPNFLHKVSELVPDYYYLLPCIQELEIASNWFLGEYAVESLCETFPPTMHTVKFKYTRLVSPSRPLFGTFFRFVNQHLSNLKNLTFCPNSNHQEQNINPTDLENFKFQPFFSKLHTLEFINWPMFWTTGKAINEIGSLPNLTRAELNVPSGFIRAERTPTQGNLFPSLTYLRLTTSDEERDLIEFLDLFARNTALEELDLLVWSTGFPVLASMIAIVFRSLKRLKIGQFKDAATPLCDDDFIQSLLPITQSLTSLTLSRVNFPSQTLFELARNSPQLTHLSIKGPGPAYLLAAHRGVQLSQLDLRDYAGFEIICLERLAELLPLLESLVISLVVSETPKASRSNTRFKKIKCITLYSSFLNYAFPGFDAIPAAAYFSSLFEGGTTCEWDCPTVDRIDYDAMANFAGNLLEPAKWFIKVRADERKAIQGSSGTKRTV